LGLQPGCSQAEIKSAYRLLALKHHPDKNNGSNESEALFKEIAAAYLILGDEAKRNAYDFTKGFHRIFAQSKETGETPATYLIMFKSIKSKVLNAGGRINHGALFKVIDDILTFDNIDFLIKAGHVITNNLIIDEVLIACVFLQEPYKSAIHAKLGTLANGDPMFRQKLALLSNKPII
jgi:molecular chaperone DnaJ